VLRGAQSTLQRCAGVQMEMSLLPLYEGQLLMRDLWNMLDDSGFDLWSIAPVFVDENSGRMLQVEAAFFRKDAAGA
jgi:hypothetical protein